MRQESSGGPAHLHRSAKEVATPWMESTSKVNMTISSAMVRGGSRRSNTVRTASGASTSSAESNVMEPEADKSDSYSTNVTTPA